MNAWSDITSKEDGMISAAGNPEITLLNKSDLPYHSTYKKCMNLFVKTPLHEIF